MNEERVECASISNVLPKVRVAASSKLNDSHSFLDFFPFFFFLHFPPSENALAFLVSTPW